MRVETLANNQVIIKDKEKKYFFSYDTCICVMDDKSTVLDRYAYDCSTTTKKYLSQFLGEGFNEIQAKIDNKTYKLKNLNK